MPVASEFTGSWSCPTNGPYSLGYALLLTITANGNELTGVLSGSPPGGPFSCVQLFTVSGATANLVPNDAACTGPGAIAVNGSPSSETLTVRASTLTITGPAGYEPRTLTCVKQ